MKNHACSLFMIKVLLLPIFLVAQDEIRVQGKVTDSSDNPLNNVNIIIVDESFGSSTDQNGDFIFTLPAKYSEQSVVLEASYIGFVAQSIKINLAKDLNIYNFQMEKDVLSLKPIMVTAQRREENLMDVPIAITAMQGKEMKSRGVERVFDLQNSVPNFFLGDGTVNFRAASSIRGISSTSFASGVEARANYYVDDVYMGRPVAVYQELFDLERLEILKGPQGTLFGKNTVSGVINITGNKPVNTWQGTVNIDAGNFNYLNNSFVFNAPINNKLFTRFSAKIMRRDGFVKNVHNNKDLNGQNIINGRLQMRYFPIPNLDINLSFDAMWDRTDGRAIGIELEGPGYAEAPGPREVSHDLDEFEHRDIFGSSLNMVYQFPNDYRIKSITAFRKNRNWANLDEDLSPEDWVFNNQKVEDAHFTQEFRLVSPLLENFNFVTGLFYFYQTSDYIFDLKASADSPVLPNFNFTSEGPVKSNSLAGYFHGNFNLINNFTLFGGLRYTYEFKEVNWDQFNNYGLYIDLENYTDTYSKGVFSPQIGLQYSPHNQLMFYAKSSWGYKSGGWGNFAVRNIEYLKLQPEYSVSYEAGGKLTALNNRLSLNTALFLNTFDDFQTEIWQVVPPPFNVVLPVYTNAAKVSSKGFEIDLTVKPLEALSVMTSFGYVDAKYDKFTVSSNENYEGHKMELAPETEYSLSAEYNIPVTHIGTFSIRGDYIYKDDYYFDASNKKDFYVPSYALINGKIGYQSPDGSIGLFLWGKNITDELYMLTRAQLPLPVRYAWYGMPRTYGIQLTYSLQKN